MSAARPRSLSTNLDSAFSFSFLYIIPMIKWGKQITPEQRAIPWYKFAIMGGLDGIAGANNGQRLFFFFLASQHFRRTLSAQA